MSTRIKLAQLLTQFAKFFLYFFVIFILILLWFLYMLNNIDNYDNKIANDQRIFFCLCFTDSFYFNGCIYKKIQVMMQ
jgi:hypothetical protein